MFLCECAGRDRECSFVFFFFQAEDGIRDYKVTGVQTCALPISLPRRHLNTRPNWPFSLFCAVTPSYKSETQARDRKSTRLNSSHLVISYAVFCLKKKKTSSHRLKSKTKQ